MNRPLLHQLVTTAADRDPTAVAVVDGDRTFSYEELDETSSRLAGLLVEKNVQRGDPVGVYAEKSAESLIAIYGVMKAGAAYVPLDPSTPASRIAAITENCGIRVLVSPSRLGPRWRPLTEAGAGFHTIVVLDEVDREATRDLAPDGVSLVTREDVDACAASIVRTIDDDLAYVLYTSGSTGSPKGVMVSHRNAIAFAEWAAREFVLRPSDRVAQLAPLIFDLSTFDLFSSAFAGAAVHLVGPKASMFPTQLRSFVDDHRISVMYAVPSLLTMLVERGKLSIGAMPSLRLVLFAGEVFPTRHLAQLMRFLPHSEFANLYGPTETNVCTFHRVVEVPADDDPPASIGVAIANDETIVVGEDGLLAATGQPGELYVRGATVMQGYWGDPERTKAVLVEPPGRAGGREPAYRTGDLVRQEADGTLTFLGRRDNQVKRRGYRIELGDIEAAILRHRDVVECAVSAVPDETAGVRIIAHVGMSKDLRPRDLAKACADLLPRYMLPDDFQLHTSLPKTATGKIDRSALSQNTTPPGDHDDDSR